MREVRLRAFAKVNYALDVLGLRADGYHEVGTVMQSISLADEVGLRRATGGFDLSLEPEEVETGPQERNTTYLAWKALQRLTGKELPVEVTLRKEIPAGAGLGGGSADAAAVLVGLNELFGLGLRVDELRGIGAGVGADVPFCVSGGTALGEGVGEILTPLPAPPAHLLVVAKPLRSAETGKIYHAFDEVRNKGHTLRRACRLGVAFGESPGPRLSRRQRPGVRDKVHRLRGSRARAVASSIGGDGGFDERQRDGSLRHFWRR